ncbi:hypothetical protein GCM10023187_01550 [Nibrella viscosa]|uniref:Uncharacterized protein n=1 Tax=Nibrella viscosa TaxID=1084524 RepID=A0ABP8JSF5_9BACT
MKRRLFVRKIAAAGVTIPFLSLPSFAVSPAISWQQQAADDIRKGFIGTIRQIHLTHTYHPEVTSTSALRQLAQQDIELAGALAGINLSAAGNMRFAETPSAPFGSYAAQFQSGGVRVYWQGLARHGSDPTPPAQTIQLVGSKGILNTTPDGPGYQVQDYTGRVLRQLGSKPLPAYPKA